MRVTLNLLPPKNKTAVRVGFIFAYLQSLLFLMLLLVIAISGTLFAVKMMLVGIHTDLAARPTTDENVEAILQDIRHMNGSMQELDKMQQRFVPWSKVLEQITALLPEGVSLESLRVDNGATVRLGGMAGTRDDVLLLQKNLEKSLLFTNVQSPISNILQQKNVKFDFQATLAAAPAKPVAPTAAPATPTK